MMHVSVILAHLMHERELARMVITHILITLIALITHILVALITHILITHLAASTVVACTATLTSSTVVACA
jgi:hypothetical protein